MALTLQVTDIMKSYDGKAALKGCSFVFDSAGVYALMGPNGSGKSTFLRICALLEKPDHGDVSYFSGEGVLPPGRGLRRRITMVLPRVGVFNTSVFGNAAYGLHMRGYPGRETERRVHRALEAVGLVPKQRQNALTLSSGETQRLGLARALVIEPELLFLDEPTASIDEENRSIVEEIILRLKGEGRTTVVITTHDREQAERLAGRVILMHAGGIVGEKPKIE